MLALTALLSVLSLTGCGSAPQVLPKVEMHRIAVPDGLLSCQPQPPPPLALTDDRELAIYILALADAGDDCRDRLGRVRALIAAQAVP
jgi:hypothetical protein